MTLLEILLVMGLLAMLGGLLSFKAKDLFDMYAFRQDTSRFLSRLELARQYASSYQADVEICFYQKNGHFVCELKSDEPYLRTHKMFYKPFEFKKIKKISFEGMGQAESLLFSGTGWMFPTASLEIRSNTKEEKIVILPIGASFS